jgi:hypothetical protein
VLYLTKLVGLPEGCKLDGYDISFAQFHPAKELPSRVTLRQHDILKPLSPSTKSVRAFVNQPDQYPTQLSGTANEITERDLTTRILQSLPDKSI